jgi:hypothetical protein
MDKKVLLKVLVGSHAHGLADETSDKDYRAVYILPTSQILSLGYRYKANDWVEGDEDNTAYELGHFLMLAQKCNPTILEVFKAPIIEAEEDGLFLKKMMSWCWNPNDTFNAFVGYGLNQRKKFLDKKDNRQDKYACAYIRTLIALYQLLTTEDFTVEVPSEHKEMLMRFKKGNYKIGEVIDEAEKWTNLCKEALPNCEHEPIPTAINGFLLSMRKKYWEID